MWKFTPSAEERHSVTLPDLLVISCGANWREHEEDTMQRENRDRIRSFDKSWWWRFRSWFFQALRVLVILSEVLTNTCFSFFYISLFSKVLTLFVFVVGVPPPPNFLGGPTNLGASFQILTILTSRIAMSELRQGSPGQSGYELRLGPLGTMEITRG